MTQQKFDLNSIIPEGYDAVDYRPPKAGELFLTDDVESRICACRHSWDYSCRIILKKKWVPQKGELVAVRWDDYGPWCYSVFVELVGANLFRATTWSSANSGYNNWRYIRQVTDDELATLFPSRK